MSSVVAVSGSGLQFPSWGRSFWQARDGGRLICLYASGTQEVNYIESADSGNTWTTPQFAFPVDDFGAHNNFDTTMDRYGNVHCVHRYNGSGCYSFLAKTPGSGWAPSGVTRGFFDCRPTTTARDFNGMIEVFDQAQGGGFAMSGPSSFPSAFITAVSSGDNVQFWYLDSPFTAVPTFKATVSPTGVGPDGGFPVINNGAGDLGTTAVSFYVSGTGISFRQWFVASFGDGFNGWPTHIAIDPNADETSLNRLRGHIGDAPYTPNMAYCRIFQFGATGVIDETYMVLTSDANLGTFELYSTAQEINGVGQWWGRVDSYAGATGYLGTITDPVRRLVPDDLPFKYFEADVAGADPRIGGAPVDIGYFGPPLNTVQGRANKVAIHLYFLQTQLNGDQAVYRVKGTAERDDQNDTNTKTRYTFTSLDDSESGINVTAYATIPLAGAGSSGLPNTIHWHGMKIPRISTLVGAFDQTELVATIGRGVSSSGTPEQDSYIYMWDFEGNLDPPHLPTYATNYTADSGGWFIGISGVSGITNPQNLFDGSTATSGQIQNSGTITLEFKDILNFNRVEVLWNSPPSGFWGIDIESSFDDVTYETVHSLPSGTLGASPSLIKLSSEGDPYASVDPTVTEVMYGFAGKYVRLTFNGADAVPRDVREVKLYGANTTAGFTATSGWDSYIQNNSREGFETTSSGLPSGLRTSGDWDWFLDSGIHTSGQPIFVGERIGYFSNTAVRTARPAPPNTSGILEADVYITAPKQISFDIKWDLLGDVPGFILPSDPNDDFLFLEVITPTGTIDLTNQLYTPPYVTPWGYRRETITLSSPGLNTLRWTFRRGDLPTGAPLSNAEGAVWIDNIVGLDIGSGGSTHNQLTTLNAYLNGAEALVNNTIYAWTSGSQAESDTVNAWMSGLFETPSEIINAYHAGEFAATGTINAYLAAIAEYQQSYGFIEGSYPTATGAINGYMINSGSFDMLYGHMQNRLNEAINGFLLGPSGALDSINAYVFTPYTLMINGYMQVEDKTQIQVNAYMDAFGIGDQINGYMLASGLNLQSYGYIKADGALDAINAYMKTGDNQALYGYLQGIADATGVINAWMSGIGAMSQAINSYIMGISGVPTGVINGFIEGVELPNGKINAYVIGFDGSGACNFPTPTLSTPTIPTGNFFT